MQALAGHIAVLLTAGVTDLTAAPSKPTSAWSDFISNATTGVVIGAVLAFMFAVLVERWKTRRDNLLGLHKEFYELMALRTRLSNKLKYDKPVPTRLSTTDPAQTDIWALMAFYERLYFLFRKGLVSRRDCRDLFGENLPLVDEECFRPACLLSRFQNRPRRGVPSFRTLVHDFVARETALGQARRNMIAFGTIAVIDYFRTCATTGSSGIASCPSASSLVFCCSWA